MINNIERQKNLQKLILIIFYLTTIIIILFVFKDFGIHIEEKFHRLNGLYWLKYVSEIFNLDNIHNAANLKINEIYDYTLSSVEYYNKYGVILDLPVAFIEIVFGIDDVKNLYEVKHFLSFLLFLISSFFFFLILKKRFKNFYICLLGIILFLTTPRIFGDSFLYKDILFLSLFNIAIYFFLKTINQSTLKNLFLFSFFTAASFCTRIFALFIPITYLFIIIIKNFYDKKIFKNLKNYLINIFFFIIFYFYFIPLSLVKTIK